MISEATIQGCLDEDRKAQKKVYETYFPLMLSIVRRYIKDEEESLDVLNQGFIKIFRKVDQYHFQNSLKVGVNEL